MALSKCLNEVIAGIRGKPGDPGASEFGDEPIDIRDVFGHDKSDLELLQAVDQTPFFISKGTHIPFLTSTGRWAFRRGRYNMLRGDASSITDHRKSLRSVGLIQELGGEPFVMQSENPDDNETYEVCHFASRFESLHLEWLADKDKTCKPIQLSFENGARKCKVYSRNSPAWLHIFLVACGNVGNGTATVTTILEKWTATKDIEPAWRRKYNTMNWNTNSWTQKTHDDTKFEFINALRQGWWVDYQSYEVSNTFYKSATKERNNPQDKTSTATVWDVLYNRCRDEVDLSCMAIPMQNKQRWQQQC